MRATRSWDRGRPARSFEDAGETPAVPALRLQQPPQAGHRAELVEPIDRRDKLVRPAGAQDRCHQVERFGGDFVGIRPAWSFVVRAAKSESKQGYSAFEGQELTG